MRQPLSRELKLASLLAAASSQRASKAERAQAGALAHSSASASANAAPCRRTPAGARLTRARARPAGIGATGATGATLAWGPGAGGELLEPEAADHGLDVGDLAAFYHLEQLGHGGGEGLEELALVQ